MRHRLIGYARVSKTDGSQSLDLQRDALRAAGIDDAANPYHDLASGVRDDRPGFDSCAAGRLVFGIFAALAEFKRELIRERTVAGLKAARARGRQGRQESSR